MNRFLALFFLFGPSTLFAPSQQAPEAPIRTHVPTLAGPLAPLFNGHDLGGFQIKMKPDSPGQESAFRVEDGGLHFTGQGYGGLVTEKSYQNYYLRAEFAWGESTFGARQKLTRKSGILIHVQGSKSVGFQIGEGVTGGMELIGGPSVTAHGVHYTSGAEQTTVIDRNEKEPVTDVTGFRSPTPDHEMERLHGHWNLLELIVDGGHVRYFVNGTEANEGYDLSLASGQIMFQSQGAEIRFRNVEIAPLAPEAINQGTQLETFVGGRVVEHPWGNHTSWAYAWPGVYFEAQFTGNAVDVQMDDDQNDLYLDVDGVHKLTLTRPGQTTVTLRDLGPGRHLVRLEKISETQHATATFLGFYVASGKDALSAPRHDRRIAFIGDSYTVGYGNTSRGQTCTVEDVRATTNTSEAFGPLTAKHFDADYRILASSGHGVVRNYNNFDPGITMPYLLRYALFDNTTADPKENWTPDVIVVGLGTNDFSTQLGEKEKWKTREALRYDFIHSYAEFVEALRKKYPAAPIILMSSTNLDNEILNATNAVEATVRQDGLTDVEVIAFNKLDFAACHGHPSLNDEPILTKQLTDSLSRLPKFASIGSN